MESFQEDKFEFWRDLKWPDPKTEHLASEFGEVDYQEVPKQKASKKTVEVNKDKKARTRVKAALAALLIVVGYGIHEITDYVSPYVEGYVESEKNRIAIAECYDTYKNNGGYLAGLDLVYETVEEGSLLSDPIRDFDYDSPDNVWLDSTGKKVGPLVDYYDGFDAYMEEETGKGYYQRVYENNNIAKMFGGEGEKSCVYTPEELEKMYGQSYTEDNMTFGGK